MAFAASWLKAVFFADNLLLNGDLPLSSASGRSTSCTSSAEHRLAVGDLLMQLLVWSPLSAVVTAPGRRARLVAGHVPHLDGVTPMSFHPNDVQRRGRVARGILAGSRSSSCSAAFFRTQVLRARGVRAAVGENRLREVPLPAPRGIIYDRNGQVIAENVPGYSVSILSPKEDSLRAALQRLSRDRAAHATAQIEQSSSGGSGARRRGRR